jgi:hypothetical protein
MSAPTPLRCLKRANAALATFAQEVERGYVVSAQEVQLLCKMKKDLYNMRRHVVVSALKAGTPAKVLADVFACSEARISQLKHGRA